MMIAAAGTKPSRSGCDMRYATTPARASPTAIRIAPTMSASNSPSSTYFALPIGARGLSAEYVSSAVTAVGPGCR
jgi:hypothetical protein